MACNIWMVYLLQFPVSFFNFHNIWINRNSEQLIVTLFCSWIFPCSLITTSYYSEVLPPTSKWLNGIYIFRFRTCWYFFIAFFWNRYINYTKYIKHFPIKIVRLPWYGVVQIEMAMNLRRLWCRNEAAGDNTNWHTLLVNGLYLVLKERYFSSDLIKVDRAWDISGQLLSMWSLVFNYMPLYFPCQHRKLPQKKKSRKSLLLFRWINFALIKF